MNEIQTCPKCEAELPAGIAPEMCPRCLMRQGFDSDVVVTGAVRSRAPAPSIEDVAADFPQLEILEVLGQGGMGVVYKARQKNLDRLVALKILTVSELDPSFSERFAREAKALASLDHPNIVHVHDSGQAGGRWYLLMEYVDGTDLRRMIRASRVAPREALSIVSQVCDALQYAHDQGVVHRDIKPENVLVDRGGRAGKIADFGLAKLVGRSADAYALTGSHQAMGTPHYMAPEQIERPLEVDHRADIYSLGVVFYELLTGELPLGRFVPPSEKIEVDVRVDEVVLKALEKEPPRRYQHVSEVKTRVDDISRAGPGSGAAIPPEQRRSAAAAAATDAAGHRRAPRFWHVAGLGALSLSFLCVALILVGLWWVEPLQADDPITMVGFAIPAMFFLFGLASGAAMLWKLSASRPRPPHADQARRRWGPVGVALLIFLLFVPFTCAGLGAALLIGAYRYQSAAQVGAESEQAAALDAIEALAEEKAAAANRSSALEEAAVDPVEDPAGTENAAPVSGFSLRLGSALSIANMEDRAHVFQAMARERALSNKEQLDLLEAIWTLNRSDLRGDSMIELLQHQVVTPDAEQWVAGHVRRLPQAELRSEILQALSAARRSAGYRMELELEAMSNTVTSTDRHRILERLIDQPGWSEVELKMLVDGILAFSVESGWQGDALVRLIEQQSMTVGVREHIENGLHMIAGNSDRVRVIDALTAD